MGRAKKVKYSYYTGDAARLNSLVYMGWDQYAYYSVDGKSFTKGEVIDTFGSADHIDYSPSLDRWLIGGYNFFRYSDDGGVTWTFVSFNLRGSGSGGVNRVIWVDGKGFFAVTYDTGTSFSYSGFSADGISWARYGNNISLPSTTYLSYSPSLDMFIVRSSSTTSSIRTSIDDMVTWQTQTLARTSSGGVWWVDFLGLFLVMDNRNSITHYQTSPDGINWTQRTFPVNRIRVDVCVGLDKIIVNVKSGGGNPASSYTSLDAINWTLNGVIPNLSDSNPSPYFSNRNNIYYSIGSTTYTSTDAVVWTSVSTGNPSSTAQSSPDFDGFGAKRY